jgi:hypothetical protein
MKEGMEELNIEEEAGLDLKEVKAEIEEIIEQGRKEPPQPGEPRPLGGINPKHLEEKDLELFGLFNRDLLKLPRFQSRAEEIFKSIETEKNSNKRNSRKNLLDEMIKRAERKFGKEELEQERAKDN